MNNSRNINEGSKFGKVELQNFLSKHNGVYVIFIDNQDIHIYADPEFVDTLETSFKNKDKLSIRYKFVLLSFATLRLLKKELTLAAYFNFIGHILSDK